MEAGRERDDDGEGESLEDAAKGIATGIVGKFKEVAGELLEDEALEREGLRQQQESEEMRSGRHPDEGDAPA
jgi:uncharacterized protein YjbJ (UPF0337 family)